MAPTNYLLAAYRQAEFYTSKFRLRPICEEDQPLMFHWRSDAETARFLSAPAPESLDSQMDWFKRIRTDPAYWYHIIEDQGQPIGFTSLINADPATSDAEWGVVIGKRRGQGLVNIIAPLCCKCAMTLMGLENLYTCINQEHGAAIRKMEQVGAVLVEGPHTYRKTGELLFQINSTRFKNRLISWAETDPEWSRHLEVEMYLAETEA